MVFRCARCAIATSFLSENFFQHSFVQVGSCVCLHKGTRQLGAVWVFDLKSAAKLRVVPENHSLRLLPTMEPKALRRPLTRSPRRRQFPAHTIFGMSPSLFVTGTCVYIHAYFLWTCNHVSDVVHLCLHLWDASGGGNGRRHVARLQSRCLYALRLLCAQHPRPERHLHHCTTKLLRCLASCSLGR